MNLVAEYFNWVIVGLLGAEKMNKFNFIFVWFTSLALFILLLFLAHGMLVLIRYLLFVKWFYYINLKSLGYCGHVFVNRITRRAVWWNGGVSKKIKNPEKLDYQTIEFMDVKIVVNFTLRQPVKVYKKGVRDD